MCAHTAADAGLKAIMTAYAKLGDFAPSGFLSTTTLP
jgi:hypothetical protein